jgi:creatinine amidohydrolase
MRNRVVDAQALVLGEVGLGGELRSVSHIDNRLAEAEKMGFVRAVIPKGNKKNLSHSGKIEIIAAETAERALEAVLRDVIRSLECHGIHKLVLLNGHGGNELKPLLREWYGQTKVFVTVVDWWKVGSDKYAEIFSKPDDHAGEMETSVALALYPELVELDKASDGAKREARFEAIRRGWAAITRQWHLLTESSGVGDPRAATREKGERYLQIVTERLAQFLVELSAAEMDETFPFAQ